MPSSQYHPLVHNSKKFRVIIVNNALMSWNVLLLTVNSLSIFFFSLSLSLSLSLFLPLPRDNSKKEDVTTCRARNPRKCWPRVFSSNTRVLVRNGQRQRECVCMYVCVCVCVFPSPEIKRAEINVRCRADESQGVRASSRRRRRSVRGFRAGRNGGHDAA